MLNLQNFSFETYHFWLFLIQNFDENKSLGKKASVVKCNYFDVSTLMKKTFIKNLSRQNLLSLRKSPLDYLARLLKNIAYYKVKGNYKK